MSDSVVVDPALLEKFNSEFFDLCEARHATGAEEYGPVAFLTAPLASMAYEELADFANYIRYMYIRMRVVEEALRESGIDITAAVSQSVELKDKLPFGAASFTPTEDLL